MKRLLCLLAAAALLTGCGSTDSNDQPEKQTSAESSSEAPEAPAEPSPESAAEEVTEAPAGKGGDEISQDYVSAYKEVITSECSKVSAELGSVSYALFDFFGDSSPELLVKTGTCEADYMVSVYTMENGSAVTIGEPLPGSHTSFGENIMSGCMALLTGHMGYGTAVQYTVADGQLISAGGELETEYSDSDDFYNIVMSQGYKFIAFAEIWYGSGEPVTWVFNVGQDGRYTNENEEHQGADLSFLENWEKTITQGE